MHALFVINTILFPSLCYAFFNYLQQIHQFNMSSSTDLLRFSTGRNSELTAMLAYDTIVRYIDLVQCLNPTMTHQKASYHSNLPKSLTVVSIHEFLSLSHDLFCKLVILYICSGNFSSCNLPCQQIGCNMGMGKTHGIS